MKRNVEECKSVLADLEKASGGSRALDAAVAIAVGYIKEYSEQNGGYGCLRGYEGPSGQVPYSAPWWPERKPFPPEDLGDVASGNRVPNWTASLDAAIALVERVLPGWEWLRKSPGTMTVYDPDIPEKTWAVHYDARGATPPLALLTAMFRALVAKMEGAE